MLIDSYDQGVIDVLDIYMEDCKEITLIEFGRGNGALAKKYLEAGKKVTIIEMNETETSEIVVQDMLYYKTGTKSIKPQGRGLKPGTSEFDMTKLHTGLKSYRDEFKKAHNFSLLKYDNVNTIAPDSCFHVAYMDTRKEDKLNYNGDIVEAKGQPMEVEEHFDFKVDGSKNIDSIKCYTTRPDTLFGMSFLALSVDHPVANLYKNNQEFTKFKKECSNYITKHTT